MLQSLVEEKAKFILVGAYAMAAHGFPRATMDIDIWVMPSHDNANAVLRALRRFGASIDKLSEADLQAEGTIFQIGVAPRRIDIITGVTGLRFQDAFVRSITVDIDGIPIRILAVDDLIQNKRATGRTKDLADAEALEALKNQPED